VKLNSWPVAASMFDGDAAAGPVPTLFSEDPEATLRAILASPARAHHNIQKIAKVFLAGEPSDCQIVQLFRRNPGKIIKKNFFLLKVSNSI